MNKQNLQNNNRIGFTLIEILVVIAIIAVLAGILLAALSGVQEAAKKTQSSSLMQSFARACDEFALDHGRYPGLLPETLLGETDIASTQNALLELMGGARIKQLESPTSVVDEYDSFSGTELFSNETDPVTGLQWSLKFDKQRFGEGPWVNGRVFEPYFSPKSSDLKYDPDNPDVLPTLVDSWETPIIYLRSARKSGPIIDDPENSGNPNYVLPQFDLPNMEFDLLNTSQSLIYPEDDRIAWLTMLLAHPTFWEQGTNWTPNGVAWGTSRGSYMLLSAGPDRIYLETSNAPTNPENEQPFQASDLTDASNTNINPSIMESFDDVVIHGGA
ncbi:MAG: type II secretion system protein [Phycisphaerales bacterium]|jgi:prepilin-type N-terminal cleavage/methylation domain-containing protein|nr:type II secretion system protein [Phycisphaerales bacterium]